MASAPTAARQAAHAVARTALCSLPALQKPGHPEVRSSICPAALKQWATVGSRWQSLEPEGGRPKRGRGSFPRGWVSPAWALVGRHTPPVFSERARGRRPAHVRNASDAASVSRDVVPNAAPGGPRGDVQTNYIFIENASMEQLAALAASSDLGRSPSSIAAVLQRLASLHPPHATTAPQPSSPGGTDTRRVAAAMSKKLLSELHQHLATVSPQVAADIFCGAGALAHLPGMRHWFLEGGPGATGPRMLLLITSKAAHLSPAALTGVLAALGRLGTQHYGLAALRRGLGQHAAEVLPECEASGLVQALKGLLLVYRSVRGSAVGAGWHGGDEQALQSETSSFPDHGSEKSWGRGVGGRGGARTRHGADEERAMVGKLIGAVLEACKGKLGRLSLPDLIFIIEASRIRGGRQARGSGVDVAQAASQPLLVQLAAALGVHGGAVHVLGVGAVDRASTAGHDHDGVRGFSAAQLVESLRALAVCSITLDSRLPASDRGQGQAGSSAGGPQLLTERLARALCERAREVVFDMSATELAKFVWAVSKVKMAVDSTLAENVLMQVAFCERVRGRE